MPKSWQAGVLYKKIPCVFTRQVMPKRWRYRRLLQSNLMAHAFIRLVLLYSYSDTVRGNELHKTLISTLLIPFCLPHNKPNKAFCSAKRIADNRASLTPRIARLLYFNLSGAYLQVFFNKKRAIRRN